MKVNKCVSFFPKIASKNNSKSISLNDFNVNILISYIKIKITIKEIEATTSCSFSLFPSVKHSPYLLFGVCHLMSFELLF